MHRRHKLIASIWTTLLASPTLLFCVGYARLTCGEMDSCPTGGAMPYAGDAIMIALILTILQAAFLVMLWRSAPEH